MKQLIFTQIVLMDKSRILSRLRSQHAARTRNSKGKKSLPRTLLQTIDQYQPASGVSNVDACMSRARSQSSKVWQIFELFGSAEARSDESVSLELLKDLLAVIHRLDIEKLEEALGYHRNLDPSIRDYLIGALRKLGRYYGVAISLTNAARDSRCSIFNCYGHSDTLQKHQHPAAGA